MRLIIGRKYMTKKSTVQEIVEIRYKMILAIAFLILGLLVASAVLWYIFKKL
ncbi:MAG: hypothetical protein QXL78_01995 [Methanocellales archaeon]